MTAYDGRPGLCCGWSRRSVSSSGSNNRRRCHYASQNEAPHNVNDGGMPAQIQRLSIDRCDIQYHVVGRDATTLIPRQGATHGPDPNRHRVRECGGHSLSVCARVWQCAMDGFFAPVSAGSVLESFVKLWLSWMSGRIVVAIVAVTIRCGKRWDGRSTRREGGDPKNVRESKSLPKNEAHGKCETTKK
jgi:hypothetical protein